MICESSSGNRHKALNNFIKWVNSSHTRFKSVGLSFVIAVAAGLLLYNFAPNPLKSLAAVTIQGDVNGDGKVDIFDLSILLSNFGKSITATPTPTVTTTPTSTPVITPTPTPISSACNFKSITAKVMPVGDSITYGLYATKGGYRYFYFQKLAAVKANTVSVGSLTDTLARSFDEAHRKHDGHSGWTIDQIRAQINGWLATSQPDLILLHIGTNDAHLNDNLSTAPDRLGALIDQMTSARPNAQIYVASLIPSSDVYVNARINTYNQSIPGVVNARAAKGKHVYFVDMNKLAGLTPADYVDKYHPNDAGGAKIATVWYNSTRSCFGL